MRPAALALSPHLDDAAFSCGGTLAALAADGWQVTVATAFTASVQDPQGFALACQLDKGLGAAIDYMELRREEDAVAMRHLGVEPPLWLPFAEAPHRGYESAGALFGGVRTDDAVDRDLAHAFGTLMAEFRPELVLAPQAIGGHVDHIQLARALRSLAPDCPILWWADFPYTVRLDTPQRPLGVAMDALDPAGVTLSNVAREAKRAACAAYESQLGYQFGGPAGLDGRLAEMGDTERFRLAGRIGWPLLQVG